jgi:hypothetical protein
MRQARTIEHLYYSSQRIRGRIRYMNYGALQCEKKDPIEGVE